MKKSALRVSLVIVTLILAVHLLSACQMGWPIATDPSNTNSSKSEVEQVIRDLETALNNLDDNKADELLLTNDETWGTDGTTTTSNELLMFNLLYVNYKSEIIKTVVKGDQATVSTRLTNINMDNVYETFFEHFYAYDYDSEILAPDVDPYDVIDSIFIDLMSEESSTVTFTHDIEMVRVAGQWKILLTDVLCNKMLGNFSTEINEAYGDYNYMFVDDYTEDDATTMM